MFFFFFTENMHESPNLRVRDSTLLSHVGSKTLVLLMSRLAKTLSIITSARTMAAHMWVRSLPFQPQISGKYEPVEGREANGQGVWRQVSGPGWLYNSNESVWFVTVHEHCVGHTGGIIGALAPYGAPEQCAWKRWSGPVGGWVPDPDVEVTATAEDGLRIESEKAQLMETRIASAPASLVLNVPHGNLSGTYRFVGRVLNAQPVWEHEEGTGLLFADSFNFWRLADGEAGLEEGSGVVQSADISPITWPSAVAEWKGKAVGGESDKCVPGEWLLDSRIQISAL